MNIIEKNIDELIPYKKNPRNNTEAIDYVANSIKEFGFKVPVIIDKNNVIVAGHTRILAAKKLGINDIPCIIADDLTDDQIKAYRLADNKVSEFSSWNIDLLEEELSELVTIDMGDFGFVNLDETELDLNEFFEKTETKEKEPEKIQCPHCGEWFEA